MAKERIGKYEIVDELGRGGMGVVYKAVDPGIQRTVALKVLAPSAARSAQLRRRFRREARAAGNLQHPNIVVIYEIGEDGRDLYIAMEHLQGKSLDHLLLEGAVQLPLAAKLGIVAQVARGLHYAHEHGVIHRDIKPPNVIVLDDGTAKIVDFGIARVVDQRRLTSTGQVLGTPLYMSPEQVRGQALDGRSDIFSAGVMLYEMLTGSNPFVSRSTLATFNKILEEDPPALPDGIRLASPSLEKVVRRVLAKRREERYQTAEAFANDLSKVEMGLTVRVPAVPETKVLGSVPEAGEPSPGASATAGEIQLLLASLHPALGPQGVLQLVVPFSCWGSIEAALGRTFGESDVEPLFLARIRQYVGNGGFEGVPRGHETRLLLDYREVPGLVSCE